VLGTFCTEDGDCCAGDGVVYGSGNNCCRQLLATCYTDNECCPGTACFKEDPSEAGFCKES
jgi:hypothetical protein